MFQVVLGSTHQLMRDGFGGRQHQQTHLQYHVVKCVTTSVAKYRIKP